MMPLAVNSWPGRTGLMQPLSQSCDLLERCARMDGSRLHRVVARWNTSVVSSYRAEITAQALVHVDGHKGGRLTGMNFEGAGKERTGICE
jgi:6-phosphogluconate dehydrogenase